MFQRENKTNIINISYKDNEQEWIGYMCLMSLSVQKSFIQYTNALLNCKLIQANNAFDKQNTSDTMEPRTHSTYYNLILTELDYQRGYIISICDCLTQSWCPYLLDTYTYY